MDDDMRRAGPVYDVARAGAVLRRSCPREKRLVGPGAMSRYCRPGDDPLVGDRLFPRFFQWLAIFWRIEVCFSPRR